MCEFGDQIKAGKFPVVLYGNATAKSRHMEGLLESCGATFAVSDASREKATEPFAVVDGCFLSAQDLEEVLRAD
jgi:hypothetical protein